MCLGIITSSYPYFLSHRQWSHGAKARMMFFFAGEKKKEIIWNYVCFYELETGTKYYMTTMENISKLFSFQKNIYSNFKVAFSCLLPSFH